MPRPDLTPVNDCVLIQEDAYVPYNQYKQLTHIIVPDKFEHGPEDRAIIGKVIAKAKDCKVEGLAVGDKVVLGKWCGMRFPRNGNTYILVRDYDILAVLHEH